MDLTFKRIIRQNIFCEEFGDLQNDCAIEFPKTGISVIYGPNGVGKSSLASVLSEEPDTEFEASLEGESVSTGDGKQRFHVVNDQNGRNVIRGSTVDFILGDNIKREYELKELIDSGFNDLYTGYLIPKLKSDFGISKKGSVLIPHVPNETLREFVVDLANTRSKGQNIDRADFLKFVSELESVALPEHDDTKLGYLIQDLTDSASLIQQLIAVNDAQITFDREVVRVEESSDAVAMLRKYDYLDDCVVCDTEIDRIALLAKKEHTHGTYLNRLDERVSAVLETINNRLGVDDPFGIAITIRSCSLNGSLKPLATLVGEFGRYFAFASQKVTNMFAECLNERDLPRHFEEYQKIVQEKPILTGEDVLFIEKFVNDCINRRIELRRQPDGNLELVLGDKAFLNMRREDLHLSNGEQNFISIAFELLKAQKVDAPVIVLDDPISSFDSIFKNKIVYAIAKFLAGKQQLLLTHSTDLVRLLEHQWPRSFSLYILNNTPAERNGFIHVSRDEQELLLYLYKFVEFLRAEARSHIRDVRLFLIALVPFMRSFARIVSRVEIKDDLTKIMHGYGDAVVDIASAYRDLFSPSHFPGTCDVSVDKILTIHPGSHELIDRSKYPLLNRSLVHVLNYLWLRLKVEKTLVSRFAIDTEKHDQLTPIVRAAFPTNSATDINGRVFLLSRKTLLNEFNHFEQDLNIFQPALDITDSALAKEREDILSFLANTVECA